MRGVDSRILFSGIVSAPVRVATECTGFTPCEADLLGRAMAMFKLTGGASPDRRRRAAARGQTERTLADMLRMSPGFARCCRPASHTCSLGHGAAAAGPQARAHAAAPRRSQECPF